MATKAMSAQEVAAKIGPTEFMRLCSKVATDANQKFDVLGIERRGTLVVVEVELANGTRKSITI